MAKAANKTVANKTSVTSFIASIEDDVRRADARAATKLIADATGQKATMWGSAIIGFGAYHYKYDTGREGDMCKIGLSPRKAGLVLYHVATAKNAAASLKKLGKHKVSGGCLHIAKLADVDQAVLRDLVKNAYAQMTEKYG
ncbi:MAG: DUF1801 domain-containing protein [Proteobacteria bacterium]|nr:DUF1801 domain-containing protein [Pseudomonadota bacterium]